MFVLVNLLFLPLLNSGDEFFLMYTLSGGYGDEPTNLLHMDHIWNPALGWLVAGLYKRFPGVNWYTLLLEVLQWLACSAILYVFLKKFRPGVAILFFLIIFCFVEIRALLSVNFSFTSWILASSAWFLWLYTIQKNAAEKKINLIIVIIALLLSGLLRLHVLFAVSFLFIAVFWLAQGVKWRQWLPLMLGICGVILLCNLGQKQYYRDHIPGWNQQEKLRQALYYPSNRPLSYEKPWQEIFKDSTEKAFYAHLFFYDTSVIPLDRMNAIGRSLARVRDFSKKDDWQSLHWLFIGWRIYLLLFAICFFLLWQRGLLLPALKRWWLPATVLLGVYLFLFVFMKLTEAIHMGSLLIWMITLAGVLPIMTVKKPANKMVSLSWLLLLLPLGWISIRIYERDRDNRREYAKCRAFISTMKNQEDKLFIATDDQLPLGSFYLWDLPAKNKITNLIYKDRLITNSYSGTLQRYGIKYLMSAIYKDQRIQLLGGPFPELQDYLKWKY